MLLVAAASIQAAPQVSDVSTTTTVGPTVLTGDKMGAAVFLDGYSGTTVVYQAADTSVHALTGSGPPSTSSSYAASVLLSAGIARNDTPLALAVDNQLGFTLVSDFHLSFSFKAITKLIFECMIRIRTNSNLFLPRRNISSISAPLRALEATTSTNTTTRHTEVGPMVHSIAWRYVLPIRPISSMRSEAHALD